jgi:ankyrin repeat protein
VVTAILRNVPNPQKLAEQKNKHEYPALHDAVENGLAAVVTALFSNVSNPQQLAEQQDGDDDTTLMAAMRSSQNKLIIANILESVVDAEKLIFQENDDEVNSFIYALNRDYMEAALLLFDKAKDKAALLLKKKNPDQPAGIERMEPDILKKFLEKYNGLNQ